MIKRILFAVLFCLLFVLGVGWFLLFTGTGLHVSMVLASKATGGMVSIGSSDGKMTGNWLLRDVLVTTDAADIKIGEISCRWTPRRLMEKNLHIADLAIDNVRITIKEGTKDSDTDPSFSLPRVVLPGSFLIGRLQVDTMEIVETSGNTLFGARTLSAQLSGNGDHLDVSDVSLDAPYLGVTGEAQLVMSEEWPLNVKADWWSRIEGCTKFTGSFESTRTVTDPLIHIDLVEPDPLQITVDITGLLDEISYQASVSGPDITLSGFCMEVPGAIDDLQVKIAGDLGNYQGSGQAIMVLNDEPLISTQIAFSGDHEQLTIDSGSFSHGLNQFDASGSLHFGTGLGWNAVLSTRAFDVSELLPVPETLISGNLDIYGEIDGNQISYTADLHELGITIQEHNMKIGGGMSLHGDQNGLEITNSSFVCGEGTVGVQGDMSWQDNFMWEADILLDSFNPAVIEVLPEGNISGSLTSKGSIENSQLALQAEIAALYGELSGYELVGEGAVVYRDQKLTIKDLNITNGNNSFYAKGDIDTNYDVTFQINGSELERIFPLLNGMLDVDGTMSGTRSEPVLSIKTDGRELSYMGYGVETLQAEAVADLGNMTIQSTFDFGRITTGKLQAERLTVGLNGGLEDHVISGELTLPRTTLSLSANGSVADAGTAPTWHGELDDLKVVDKQFGAWNNREPILISAGTGSVTVDEACFFSDDNRLCTEMNWKQGMWSLAVNDVRFDLASLNRWGFLEKPLAGIVEAEVSANGQASEIESIGGYTTVETLQWEPGPNTYYQDFRWFDTYSSFSLVDQDLMVEFSTRFIDDSTLDGEIGIIGVKNITDVSLIPVTGQIDLDLKDLRPLSVVTGEFLIPQGHLAGTIEVKGTLAAPLFLGDVNLIDGGLNIPFLGADLTDVQGTVEVNGSKLELDLDSRAGGGRLKSTGRFDFGAQDWSGYLSFNGSDSSLLNRRAISAVANTNLELKLGPQGGRLTGAVEVLEALVEVEKIDRSATESSDVVFVDKATESTPWPFRYDIDVSLGDDVNVEGFGLTGKLGGNLKVANNADGITIGRGFFDVREGSFVVYGSPLTIDRGRLSFDGGPVDNPGIDIKASKFIDERRSGYEKIEVGANVIGSAADFEVELYSTPKMEKGDILTYLLFDNPFNSEGANGSTGVINSAARALGLKKGSDLLGDVNSLLPVDEIRLEGGLDSQETSLVVGKNLSKELSVSYDYNLFDNAGSFRVRYEFGKGFSVESRNSFESNAVELLYSFER